MINESTFIEPTLLVAAYFESTPSHVRPEPRRRSHFRRYLILVHP